MHDKLRPCNISFYVFSRCFSDLFPEDMCRFVSCFCHVMIRRQCSCTADGRPKLMWLALDARALDRPDFCLAGAVVSPLSPHWHMMRFLSI